MTNRGSRSTEEWSLPAEWPQPRPSSQLLFCRLLLLNSLLLHQVQRQATSNTLLLLLAPCLRLNTVSILLYSRKVHEQHRWIIVAFSSTSASSPLLDVARRLAPTFITHHHTLTCLFVLGVMPDSSSSLLPVEQPLPQCPHLSSTAAEPASSKDDTSVWW